jgi:hypothetical protein
MSSMEETLTLARRPPFLLALIRIVTAPRLLIYGCCTLAVLLTCYHLGKEMAWDTLDYHFYAGFSALHDRFGQDYFPAGPQSYFNPYIFVPFYLLTTSGLTSLQVALVLAAAQSAILWLVYELALAVAPPSKPAGRLALGICSVALAYANPVLINQFGSSFADVLTSEIVIAGWLLLVGAVRSPELIRIGFAAALLGCASALKLTNTLHAVTAVVIVLAIPGAWRSRMRHTALFVAVGIGTFAVVAAPWCVRLQQHFGNPFFPMFNGLFGSPQFTTAPILSYRFIPRSFGAALWRPFAMISPRSMIHAELAAPDLRYALLLLAATLSALAWGWKRRRGNASATEEAASDRSHRALAALGSAFLLDWTLWLTASGNSRYFIPMACVAAVLAVVLIFRLGSQWPRCRDYLLLTAFVLQFYQLRFGAQYPANLPWDQAPWFRVSVPEHLASKPELFFNIGIESNSFLAPYLAPGSGLVNLQGAYTLGPGGAVGQHIEALIHRYWPHVRILLRDRRRDAGFDAALPKMADANDALEPFGLQLDASHCARIVVHGVSSSVIRIGQVPRKFSQEEAETGYYITCRVVAEKARDPAIVLGERSSNLVLDRLEDACPALFQPRRPTSYLLGDRVHGYIWAREYPNTDILAWVSDGWVHFQPMMQQEQYAGPVRAWEKGPLRLTCGRGAEGYFLRVTASP